MTTRLLALYSRPESDMSSLDEFERAYREEHLPLVQATPGLQGLRAWRVREALGGATQLFLVAEMDFEDRASLDAGIASEPMRAAGRNLRRIAPGVTTLLVVEDAPDLLPGGSNG